MEYRTPSTQAKKPPSGIVIRSQAEPVAKFMLEGRREELVDLLMESLMISFHWLFGKQVLEHSQT